MVWDTNNSKMFLDSKVAQKWFEIQKYQKWFKEIKHHKNISIYFVKVVA